MAKKLYAIKHLYDKFYYDDEDSEEISDLLFTTEDKAFADAYVEKWSNPKAYARHFGTEDMCHRLVVEEIDFPEMENDPFEGDWFYKKIDEYNKRKIEEKEEAEKDIARLKKELEHAKMFRQSALYAMLKDLEKDPKNEDKITACEREMELHPELGMYSMRLQKVNGEIFGDYNTFRFESKYMRGFSMFLFYHYDNFDFDDDVEIIKEGIKELEEIYF